MKKIIPIKSIPFGADIQADPAAAAGWNHILQKMETALFPPPARPAARGPFKRRSKARR